MRERGRRRRVVGSAAPEGSRGSVVRVCNVARGAWCVAVEVPVVGRCSVRAWEGRLGQKRRDRRYTARNEGNASEGGNANRHCMRHQMRAGTFMRWPTSRKNRRECRHSNRYQSLTAEKMPVQGEDCRRWRHNRTMVRSPPACRRQAYNDAARPCPVMSCQPIPRRRRTHVPTTRLLK